MAYNKDQWTSSFEDQMAILRPHLTQRVLTTIGLAAWANHGRKSEDPIEAARQWSMSMDKQVPAKAAKR